MSNTLRPPRTLSPSSVSTWLQCPRRFFHQKIQRIKEPPTEAQVLGNFVHEALEYFYAYSPDKRDAGALKDCMREVWLNKWEKQYDALDSHDGSKSDFKWQSHWLCDAIFQMEDPPEVDIGGRELQVKGKIGNAPMFGYVDRWTQEEDGVVISDYKTGRMPKPEYEDDSKRQVAIYSMLAEDILEQPVLRADLLYLKSQKTVSYEVDEELQNEVIETVEGVWEGVLEGCETGEFETITGPLCNWCSFKPQCPAWN